jgi:hypothetical protein
MLVLAAPSLGFLISSDAVATDVLHASPNVTTAIASSLGASYHVMTDSEMEQMMMEVGVRADGTPGSATGLAPPTVEGWQALKGKLLMLDSLPSVSLAPSLDLSTDPCFPIVGNQQSQGSCAAWAATYYCYGYLEAKDNGWTDASLGNVSHLMSPAWTYNKVDGGGDLGSWMTQNMEVICDWGCASMKTMPYNDQDALSWGSAAAFREAPLHRGLATVAMPCNGTDWTIDQVKTLLSLGTPVTFAIDHSKVFDYGLLDNDIFSAAELTGSLKMDHAQTIVGYNDSISEDGDVGAFRVVNSWGSSGSDHTDHGYYWFTYAALEKLLNIVGFDVGMCYIEDRIDYVPTLLGVWHFNSGMGRDGDITLGIGTGSAAVERTLYYVHDTVNTAHRMPAFMCADMTDFESQYVSGNTSFHIDLGSSSTRGTLSSFRVERYEGGYVPGAADQISPQSSGLPLQNPVTASVVLPLEAKINYDAALDTSSHVYTSSSVSRWVGIDHISHYGGSAIESGDTADSGESSLTVDVTGLATYGFYWRVSSESGKDFLKLSVDGSNVASISGAVEWRQQTFTVPAGHHLVKWSYAKDSANSVGEDAGYVDRLRQLPADDRFEKNNNVSTAARITPGTYPGLVCNDDDWYKVSVGAGYGIYANITFINSDGNLDLFLYATDGTTLLDSSQTSANVESVSAVASASGDYFIAIKGRNGDTNVYDMEVATPLVTSDLGILGSVSIIGGTLSFGNLSSSNEQIAVDCGDTLSGNITIQCNNPWPVSATVPLVLVPSWGPPSTSYVTVVPSIANGTSTVTTSISLVVPSNAGTYYIIACFRNETSAAYVASATSSSNGAPAWGDGNDIAAFTPAQINDAQTQGRTEVIWLIGPSYEQLWVPCDAISITAIAPDTSPPSTVIGLSGTHGSGGWFVSTVSVSLTATDDEGPVLGTYYSLDGGSWVEYSAPFTVATQGVHALSYYSVDYASNTETTRQATIKIDTTGPILAPIVTGDEGNGSWYTSIVTIDPSASDSASGVGIVSCSIDSGPYLACSGAFEVGGEGEHFVNLSATDVAGNPSSVVELHFKVDVTPPDVIPLLTGEMGADGWFVSSVKADLDIIDVCSGAGQGFMSVDGAPFTSSSLDVTTGGLHTMSYYALDAAGNPSSVAQVTFKIDDIAPETTASMNGRVGMNGWFVSPVDVGFTAVDEQSGVHATCVSLDGETWLSISADVNVSAEGTHILRYYSVDVAGNVEAEKSLTINIDSAAPTVTPSLTGPEGAPGWYRGTVNVTLHANDQGSGVKNITYRLDGGAWSNYTDALTIRANGTHVLEFFAFDVSGRWGNTTSITFTIDTSKPSTTAVVAGDHGANGWYVGAVAVTLSATDDGGAVMATTYRVDGGGWMPYITSVVIAAEGQHTMEYRSEDEAGNVENIHMLGVWVDSTAPTMSVVTASPDHSTDGTSQIAWNASDSCSGMASTELFVDGTNYGSPLPNGGVVEVRGLSDGAHNITVVGTDVAGNRAQSSTTVTVDTSPLSPTGPYGVMIDVLIVGMICVGVVLLLIVRRK